MILELYQLKSILNIPTCLRPYKKGSDFIEALADGGVGGEEHWTASVVTMVIRNAGADTTHSCQGKLNNILVKWYISGLIWNNTWSSNQYQIKLSK